MRRAVVLVLLGGLACAEERDAPPPPPFAPLWGDGEHFRDGQGRAVVLRGINARVDGLFDVSFADGRVALEDVPALAAADCERMAELGFNVLRLPVNWSGIEPERDVIDDAYLARLDAAVNCAGDAGLFVLVDLHQDAYSKEIGEDGAPLWAIQPAPAMLLEGPLTAEGLAERRTSAAVLNAFASFFADGDPHGLQAEAIDVLALLAARYDTHPAVIGVELMNEPVALVPELLHAFHVRAAEAVRAAAPQKLVFFEPTALRNLTDAETPVAAPFPVAGAVYAPHIYTLAFSDPQGELATIDADRLRPSHVAAREEARAWGVPLFVGEWGVGPQTTSYQRYLDLQLDLQDETHASSAFWLWKEDSQGSWGLHDRDADTGAWLERPDMIAVLSRPYAQRIAGTPSVIDWNGERLRIVYDAAGDAPNVLFVPLDVDVASLTCDGAPADAVRSGAIVEVTCTGDGRHELVLGL